MSVKRYVINCVGQFFELGQTPLSSLIGSDTVVVLASDYDRDVLALRSDYDTACADAMGVARKLAEMQADRDSLAAENLRLREALAAADEYLISNKLNSIGSGSILHQDMQRALSSGKEVDV